MFISSSVLANHNWQTESPLKAEITCEINGGETYLLHCIGSDAEFLKIKTNNITKSYHTNDYYTYDEGLRNCAYMSLYHSDGYPCTFDLTEHFEVRVWHGKGNDGYAKLILKILLNNEVIWQDETSTKYRWLGIKN